MVSPTLRYTLIVLLVIRLSITGLAQYIAQNHGVGIGDAGIAFKLLPCCNRGFDGTMGTVPLLIGIVPLLIGIVLDGGAHDNILSAIAMRNNFLYISIGFNTPLFMAEYFVG